MGFGFSSMPSAQQRAMQHAVPLADTMAMARQAQMGAGGITPPTAPTSAPASGAPEMNVHQPQQINPNQTFDPGGINMPSPTGGIPTPQPWNPGGVNLPQMGQGNAVADIAQGPEGASFLSQIAALFGG